MDEARAEYLHVYEIGRELFPDLDPDLLEAFALETVEPLGDAPRVQSLLEWTGLRPKALRQAILPRRWPSRILARLRAERMRYWLLQGLPVTEAASRAGFSELSTASDLYLRVMGRRPVLDRSRQIRDGWQSVLHGVEMERRLPLHTGLGGPS